MKIYQLLIFASLVLILFVFQNNLFAQMEFSGYGSTGYKFWNRNPLIKNNQEVFYEGKFQADYKVNKDIEAQLELRGSSEDNMVRLREFSVKFEYMRRMKFKVGNIKTPFGYEQLINREESVFIERSLIHDNFSEFGYTQRSVSLQVYSKYSDKDPDFPISYYSSLFKNNSLAFGWANRFSYHCGNFIYSANYMYLHKGGEEPINVNGFAADAGYESNSLNANIELSYVGNPEEQVRYLLMNDEKKVNATAVRVAGSFVFDIGGDVIKFIEPVLLLGYFAPDINDSDIHTVQTIIGVNLFFHKDVRLKINGNGLFAKNKFQSKYSSDDSRLFLELQVNF